MIKMPYTEKNMLACRKFINEHSYNFLKNWAGDMTDKMTIYPVKTLRLHAVKRDDEIKFLIGFEGSVNARVVWESNYYGCLKYMSGIEIL